MIGVVVGATAMLLMVLLRLAPASVQSRVGSALLRFSKSMDDLLGRAAYPWAVVMVVTMGLMLIGAVLSLFVPRP